MHDFFSQVLAPYSIASFFSAYHEQDILHIPRNDAAFYSNILTPEEISAYLDRQDLFYPSVRMVDKGSEIPQQHYTKNQVPIGHHKRDGLIDTEKAFSLFNSGSTFVIQAGQRYFENLSRCCLDLSNRFGSPVQANLYITPQKSVGFNPHWDTHDVFVLQITGTKTWKLYGFEKELPTVNQKFSSKNYQKEPLHTVQLKPGDFLYVPRGYVHDAMSDDGISSHITIGILSYTWIRFFHELMPQLENFREFRKAVPFWDSENLPQMIAEKLKVWSEKIPVLNPQPVVEKLRKNQLQRQPQPVRNYFQSLLDLNAVEENTVFILNDAVVYSAREDEGQFKISFLDKTIAVPVRFKAVIEAALNKKKFSTKDFGEEHPDNLLKIFKLMVKEGLIHFQKN